MEENKLSGKDRKNIKIGDAVEVIQKHHQRTGELQNRQIIHME